MVIFTPNGTQHCRTLKQAEKFYTNLYKQRIPFILVYRQRKHNGYYTCIRAGYYSIDDYTNYGWYGNTLTRPDCACYTVEDFFERQETIQLKILSQFLE